MEYVDKINLSHGGEGTKLYSTAGTDIKKKCMQNKLKLLDASVRHLGTDINYVVLQNLYEELKDKVEFKFETAVDKIEIIDGGYEIAAGGEHYSSVKCIVSVGRSGSKWMENICKDLGIETTSRQSPTAST